MNVLKFTTTLSLVFAILGCRADEDTQHLAELEKENHRLRTELAKTRERSFTQREPKARCLELEPLANTLLTQGERGRSRKLPDIRLEVPLDPPGCSIPVNSWAELLAVVSLTFNSKSSLELDTTQRNFLETTFQSNSPLAIVLRTIDEEGDLREVMNLVLPNLHTIVGTRRALAQKWLEAAWSAADLHDTHWPSVKNGTMPKIEVEELLAGEFLEAYRAGCDPRIIKFKANMEKATADHNRWRTFFLHRWMAHGEDERGAEYLVVLRYHMVRMAASLDMRQSHHWAREVKDQLDRVSKRIRYREEYRVQIAELAR